MTHPEELLAGYVDGALSDKERDLVDAHLSACETCREEIDLSARAVAVLDELPEEAVPFGVMNPVTAEIGRRMSKTGPAPWRTRLQWVAGLAAAAALVAVIAVNLPHLGGGGGSTEAARGGVASPTEPTLAGPHAEALAVTALEVQRNVDYSDPAKLSALAEQSANDLRAGVSGSPSAKMAGGNKAATAATCVAKGAGSGLTENDNLVRLIEATFGGAPAYIGVYLESPGAGQPPGKVVIWIVSKADCSVLSDTYKRI